VEAVEVIPWAPLIIMAALVLSALYVRLERLRKLEDLELRARMRAAAFRHEKEERYEPH